MKYVFSEEESKALRKRARSVVDAFNIVYDPNSFRLGETKDILQRVDSGREEFFGVRYEVCKLRNGENHWSFDTVLEKVLI